MPEIATKISDLKEGMVTSREVTSQGGMMLMPKGTVLGPRQLRLLHSWGFDAVFVEGQAVVEPEKDDLSPESHSEFHRLAEEQVHAKFATIAKRDALTDSVEKIAVDYIALRLKNTSRQQGKPASGADGADRVLPIGPTTARQFVQRVYINKLPSLPGVYHRLSAAVDDPQSTTETVSNILKRDQSLASRLLKLANSAYYGHALRVESIEEAVKIIGLNAVRDLTVATYVMGAFKNLPATLVDITEFWRHSISVGVMSGLLARQRRAAERDSYFTGGLLHDLGRLAMYQFAPYESEAILKLSASKAITCCNAELSVLGFDHSELGAELLKAWQLPRKLVELVGGHHCPLGQNGFEGDMVVHAADFIMTAVEYGSSGEARMSPLVCDVTAELSLDPNTLRDLVKETLRNCDELCSIFSD